MRHGIGSLLRRPLALGLRLGQATLGQQFDRPLDRQLHDALLPVDPAVTDSVCSSCAAQPGQIGAGIDFQPRRRRQFV